MHTIGILGAGQLGLMLAQAAHKMGVKVVILAPQGDTIAFDAADVVIEASYTDTSALRHLQETVGDGAITLEFENVPLEALEYLERRGARVHPSARVLSVAQDRFKEKHVAGMFKVPTTAYCNAMDCFDGTLRQGDVARYLPGIVKTARMGYDGKGQFGIEDFADLLRRQSDFPRMPCILERRVDFDYEVSVIVARNMRGGALTFPTVKNRHHGGILRETYYKAGSIPESVCDRAQEYTWRLAQGLGVVGLLAVEFFVTRDGDVLFNEMAPRPHNSGHWTIEGCATSQFTACVQAVLGLPFTPIKPAHQATMVNLIGAEINELGAFAERGYAVHNYGKADIKPGRKMGHVTKVDVLATAS